MAGLVGAAGWIGRGRMAGGGAADIAGFLRPPAPLRFGGRPAVRMVALLQCFFLRHLTVPAPPAETEEDVANDKRPRLGQKKVQDMTSAAGWGRGRWSFPASLSAPAAGTGHSLHLLLPQPRALVIYCIFFCPSRGRWSFPASFPAPAAGAGHFLHLFLPQP
eukprot:gene25004-biopygen2963